MRRTTLERGVILAALIVTTTGSTVVSPKHSAAAHSTDEAEEPLDHNLVYWEEVIPEEPQLPVKKQSVPKEKRKLLWNKDDTVYDPFSQSTFFPQVRRRKGKKPHPMRTNEWKLRLSYGKRNSLLLKQSVLLEFSKNGYVRVLQPSSDDTHHTDDDNVVPTAVGTWKLLPSGISWNLPIGVDSMPVKNDENQESTKTDSTVLHYHADLHLNQFGERPRMVRGVVTRDRYPTSLFPKRLFRPVIATFSAEGIGQDTADVTYQERGFGLSPPN